MYIPCVNHQMDFANEEKSESEFMRDGTILNTY